MRQKIISIMFILICLLIVKQEAYATDSIAFWQPYPKDINLLINQPTISMKLMLNENTIKEINMTINNEAVTPSYDSDKEQIYYTVTEPLEAGQYEVYLQVSFEGWEQILENSWQFSISDETKEQVSVFDASQTEALGYINDFREATGLQPLELNTSLVSSAKSHVQYMEEQQKVASTETIDSTYYTGITPTERARVQGYNGIEIKEKSIYSTETIEEVVDMLLNNPYVKIMLMDPYLEEIGYASQSGYHTFVFGRIKTSQNVLVQYPNNNATDVNTGWTSLEHENNAFEINGINTGNLIILSYNTDIDIESIEINQLDIIDDQGQNIQYELKSQLDDKNLKSSVLAIPTQKLSPLTTYTVTSELRINYYTEPSSTVTQQSIFTTGEDVILYDDIANHWANETIIKMSQKGIVEAREQGLYMPDEMITRGEFCKAIIKLLDIKTESYKGLFNDVAEDNPLSAYIESAKENNLINGYPDQSFKPEHLITRQEMAVMIENMYVYMFEEVDDTEFEDVEFLDQDEIQSWAVDSVKLAYNIGIIKGRQDGKYYPVANATRGEAAVMLERLLLIIEDDYKNQ